MATNNGIPDATPPDKRPRGGYSAPPPDESPRQDATADPKKEYVASSGYGAGLRDYLRALPVYVDDLTREVDLHVYERMRWDECVAGSLDALVYQALADDIDFRPAVDDEDSQYYDDSKAQADTINRVMADLDRPLIEWAYEMVSDAIGGGNRVSEKVVRQEEGGPYSGLWVWDRLKVKPRRHLSFAMDTFNNLRGILTAIPGTYMGLDGSIPVDPKETPNLLPREKFALLSWNSHNDDPRGRPLLRRVYVPWWEKIQTAGEWLKHLSRFGSPSLVGTTAPNSDFVPPQDEFGNPLAGTAPGPEQALLNGLERLQNGGCLVLPYGATVTALQVAQSGSAFLTKVDQCDRAISRGVLLAIRAVMEAQHGSKADSQTAQDVTGLVVRYVKNWAARMITRDLVKPLVVWNKGADAARVICPYASLTPVEHQDWSQKATAVAALKTSGFLKPSQEPALAEEMGLPPATEPVEQPQPQPQPGQQPGQDGAQGQTADTAQTPNGAEATSAPSAATFAEADPFDFGDISLGGLSREEIAEILIDAALDARDDAEFADAEFYDPNQFRDERGRWATGGGSGASQGLPHVERQAQRESAKETVQRFMAGKGSPSLQEASGLAKALSTLTVVQIHEVKREHGLQASAPDKAGLVAKLAERFRAAREAKPAEPKPPAAEHGEISRIERGPFNFVLYNIPGGRVEVRVSSGGHFQDLEDRPQLLEEAKQLFGLQPGFQQGMRLEEALLGGGPTRKTRPVKKASEPVPLSSATEAKVRQYASRLSAGEQPSAIGLAAAILGHHPTSMAELNSAWSELQRAGFRDAKDVVAAYKGASPSDLRREAVKSAIGDTYSPYNGTHQLLQDIAGKHDTLAGALAEAERQGLIDTRQRSSQTDVSPVQRDRQGEFVRRVLGQAYGEQEAPKAQPKVALPTDEQLANAGFSRFGVTSQHSGSIRKVTLGGEKYFWKGVHGEAAEREALVADLASLAGVNIPVARTAQIPGAPSQTNDGKGLITEWVQGKPVADLLTFGGGEKVLKKGVRPGAGLAPGQIDRQMLFDFLANVEDRHGGNYLVSGDKLYSIDHEYSLEVTPPTGAWDNLSNNEDLLALRQGGRAAPFEPKALQEMAAAAPALAKVLRGKGLDAEAVSLEQRGDLLHRLSQGGEPATVEELGRLAGALREG